MIKDILIFIWGRILGYTYSCDRCADLGASYMTLGIREYLKNHNKRGRYCNPCWSYIHLKHFNCVCGTYSTLRSAHQNVKTCDNCYRLIKC